MLYPPVADLLKNVNSRQIAVEAETFKEDLPEKPVTLAIREVAAGELTATLKEEYKN